MNFSKILPAGRLSIGIFIQKFLLIRVVLFATIGCSLFGNTSADQDSKLGFSITPNLGVVSPGIGGGLDINIFNLYGFNHKLMARGYEEVLGKTDSIDSHFEVGYLIGRWTRNSVGYLSASVGLSVVETVDRGREISPPTTCYFLDCRGVYEITRTVTVGVPFQLEAILMRNFMGIGLSILWNINLDQPYGGVVMEFPFGWTPR